ncbi:serine/threonine protein kinase [Mycobacterium sp. 852002-40037_SCH5390672]|uniref:serine/threonine protein kinase n=1 Tax=Mycobacterium sp. 852002-40037_SCH5390672 TaxID=1834089 RepID=UPI00080526B9|nr:serine/threonine protein kinase [Mycobacterium sp. 852002-40037_SCH5390672]OBB92521.1 serine/threonine protein kinase [Mycobacterium sp. 852002-40037_SCH5390672]
MSDFSNMLRAVTATALTGGVALAGDISASADPATTGSPSDINSLAASLSKGYGLNNCTAQNIDRSTQLAVLTCGQSPDPSGPVQAKYVLFTNADNLATSFKATIKEDVLTPCGDADQSPSNWHKDGSAGSAGQAACGTYQNGAEIIWTTDTKNTLSYLRASNTDVAALYQWWRANG